MIRFKVIFSNLYLLFDADIYLCPYFLGMCHLWPHRMQELTGRSAALEEGR